MQAREKTYHLCNSGSTVVTTVTIATIVVDKQEHREMPQISNRLPCTVATVSSVANKERTANYCHTLLNVIIIKINA